LCSTAPDATDLFRSAVTVMSIFSAVNQVYHQEDRNKEQGMAEYGIQSWIYIFTTAYGTVIPIIHIMKEGAPSAFGATYAFCSSFPFFE
jgi:hypothetical protein